MKILLLSLFSFVRATVRSRLSMQMEIIVEGISSILEGEHPAIAEQKLMSFLPGAERAQG